ncbi:MAG: MBL fold metallo-hydrolase [Deltaproteobacteria bacterium]|nr:MAG: MBL fold metallo-hydrolase [Deltaproteobacteria bacterium]
MNVTSYGAAREVTGSMHLLDCGDDRIVFDCGMFQGRRKESAEKNRVLPIDPKLITNIILSHAHIDHSGRIPMVTSRDFHGQVICTRPTADSCQYLLNDSARIQESDALYLNYKTVRSSISKIRSDYTGKKLSHKEQKEIRAKLKINHRINPEAIDQLIHKYHLNAVSPLYTVEDAEKALACFRGQPYRQPITVGKNMTCTFYDAGHIMGSAISIVRVKKAGRVITVGYTGDLGRYDSAILRNPTAEFDEADRHLDLLIMESTYGDRLHEPVVDMGPMLKKVINDTYNRGGSVLIPSFAFGRTQELIYRLHELYDNGEVPRIPIYVDSPLATRLTRVYGEHPEVYDAETKETFLADGDNPFSFKQINFVKSVEESMALNREQKPHIVLSASGMCEGGRILHHLRYKIHDRKNTILIVGFMAAHTLGRRILDQGLQWAKEGRKHNPPLVKFLGKEYPLKAEVVKLGGFSAHGDRSELLRFLDDSNLEIKRVAVVHGEESQSKAFADTLRKKGYTAYVPRAGETVRV